MMYIYSIHHRFWVNQHISPTWMRPCNEGTSPNEAAYAATWGEVVWSCNDLASMILFGVQKEIYVHDDIKVVHINILYSIYYILQYLVKQQSTWHRASKQSLTGLDSRFLISKLHFAEFPFHYHPHVPEIQASISQLLMAAPYVMPFPSDVIP